MQYSVDSPNWEYYVEEAKLRALEEGATHLIVATSWDDPEDLRTFFYFAFDDEHEYNRYSTVIEKRVNNGGGNVRAVIELGAITHG
jgi:nitrate reductase alpha subunit